MNRREVLKLGVVGVGCLGCGGGGEDVPADAAEPGSFTMCGAEVCVDLTNPANAALLEINGARALDVPDKILILRTSATEFVVLSRVCTHQGCGLAYQPGPMELACSCHGSRFSATGSVLRGPATRSLKKLTNRFDAATQTLAITV